MASDHARLLAGISAAEQRGSEAAYELLGQSDGWFVIASRAAVGDYCAECGEPLLKGQLAQRIEGGYGWRCEAHRA